MGTKNFESILKNFIRPRISGYKRTRGQFHMYSKIPKVYIKLKLVKSDFQKNFVFMSFKVTIGKKSWYEGQEKSDFDLNN